MGKTPIAQAQVGDFLPLVGHGWPRLRRGHSPADEPGRHRRPGDAAGAVLLGLHRVVPPAAAGAHQVSGEEGEVQAQADRSQQPQEQQ